MAGALFAVLAVQAAETLGADDSGGSDADSLRVAAVQMRLRLHSDEAAYARQIDRWTRRAVERGARLVVFPEDVGLPLLMLGLTGPRATTSGETPSTGPAGPSIDPEQVRLRLLLQHGAAASALVNRGGLDMQQALLVFLARRAEGIYRRIFSQAALRHAVMIAAGSCPVVRYRGPRPEVRNGGVLIDASGRPVAMTLKVNPVPLESRLLSIQPSPDHVPPVVATGLGRIGVAICWDCHFSELIARMARGGIDILVDPRANPGSWTARTAAVSHDTGLWRRAQEHDCFGIECFAVGSFMGVLFEGRTQIVAPTELTPDASGVIASAQSHDRPELVVADLNMAALRAFRRDLKDRSPMPAP